MFKQETGTRRKDHLIGAETIAPVQDNFRPKSLQFTSQDKQNQAFINLKKIGGLPAKNTGLRIITQRSMNSFDFVLAILAAEKILTLYICCYRIGKKVTGEIARLHKAGDIKNIHFILNSGIPQLTPDVYSRLKAKEGPFWTLKTAHTHAKIILAKTDLKNHYVLEGSGNLSQNGTIEQYIFEENPQAYQFHREWMEKL